MKVTKNYTSLTEYNRDKSIMNSKGYFTRDIEHTKNGASVTYLKRRTKR